MNKYLLQCCKCNHTQLIVEDISCYEDTSLIYYPLCCTLNGLGRALRREPYLSSCALKKTLSLGDQSSEPSLVEFKPMSGNNSQSCPDLLELEALTNQLQKFTGKLEPSQLNLDEETPARGFLFKKKRRRDGRGVVGPPAPPASLEVT